MNAGDPRAELDSLRARVAEQETLITELSLELAETNNGVVALYAELDDRAEQLRQVSDLKSRFLSYMSHEFRTPLGSITSITGILLDRTDGPLTFEQLKQVQFVKGAAQELTEMVNDLLDLAKVEAGRITISPAWFDMVDLFSALRGMFRPILASQSVELVFEEPVNVPRLYTDHKKLSQILRNLIANALKFTLDGSVRVGVSCEDGLVTFSVADTGIGISEEQQLALFHDFVQVDSPVQRRVRGTGLGLSLSRKLAELLGGDIRVQSSLGEGAIFRLTIPAHLPGEEGAPLETEGGGDAG